MNWRCEDFECSASDVENSDSFCLAGQMLESIVCLTSGAEECDLGDENSDEVGGGCRTDCTLPSCRDGVIEAGEECDDGNLVDNDACTNACRTPRCGDAVVQPGEACDDGNGVDDDECRNDCTLPSVATGSSTRTAL